MPGEKPQPLIDLVGEALALPPNERAGFLQSACSDPALLAEAKSLLASLARAGGFMDSPTQSNTKLDPRSGSGVERVGSTIDRYTLLEQIGEGGFGVVYLADQREPVHRRVALKVIKPGMDSAEVVARFEAERQALAIMDHPNVAKVFDGGVTPAGRPYFVMEFVPGEPITAFCDRHTYTNRQRLDLFVDVCHAVQHAHTKGIIHRDLKPSNVLVTMDGDQPVPKVIDFGVAKAINQGVTGKTIFTATGQLIGTPEYMSPEQAEMGLLDIDTRSDVYSLGVVLYELLTGSTPLAGADLRSKGFGEIQRIIREVDPPTPSTRLSSRITDAGEKGPPAPQGSSKAIPVDQVARLRRTDPAGLTKFVRGELDWIVMKALDKDRTRRYVTADSLAEDIGHYLAGEPVDAAPANALYWVRKFARRNRGPVIAVSLVTLALLAGITGTTVFALREASARGRAERAEHDERARADELDRVAKFQSSRLGDIDPARLGVRLRDSLIADARAAETRLGNTEGSASARAGALEEQLGGINFTNVALDGLDSSIFGPTLAAIRKDFADQPAVRAQLLHTAGDTMRRLGLEDQALPVVQEAYEVARVAHGESDQRTLSARSLLSTMLRRKGRLGEAEREIRATLTTARQSLGDRSRVTLTAMQYLGDVLNDQNKHAEAEKIYRETLQAQRSAFGAGDDHDVMQVLTTLAETLFRQERLGEAESLAREALDMCRRLEGDDSASTLSKMNNLASVLNAEKKYDEGTGMLREVVAKSRKTLGDNHPDLASKISNLGASFLGLRNYAEAEPLLIEGVERQRRARGPTHPSTLTAVNNLAYLYYYKGQFEEAAATLARGAQLTEGGGVGVQQQARGGPSPGGGSVDPLPRPHRLERRRVPPLRQNPSGCPRRQARLRPGGGRDHRRSRDRTAAPTPQRRPPRRRARLPRLHAHHRQAILRRRGPAPRVPRPPPTPLPRRQPRGVAEVPHHEPTRRRAGRAGFRCIPGLFSHG